MDVFGHKSSISLVMDFMETDLEVCKWHISTFIELARNTEGYSEPFKKIKMEYFCKNSQRLSAMNYFRENAPY